jgi:hypothetical protein
MATAICNGCGRTIYWSPTRGTRLAYLRCKFCGGTLRGNTAGRRAPNKGRKLVTCAVKGCGCKGYIGCRMTLHEKPGRTYDGRKIPANEPVCWCHGR